MSNRDLDEKIVKMSLDNNDFLAKVRTTLAGITSLGKGTKAVSKVDMSSSVKSVQALGNAANNTKMDALLAGVEAVKGRFSTLGVIAMTALQNITNSAVNAGKNMLSSFTVQPIMSGLQMYEGKLKAIQVILSNTQGKSNLNDVTKSLGELNDYASKTVYSFEDMTTNMGTFTAAGVDLKTSQVAIQGIGNLAAASGSSSQQAATAMYQLSQAIASGKVGLQDWNSVVNAGMGGKKFQTALQNNAKAMGKNLDASVSFRDSLQDGWLTTDVLMKTLKQFANDKSMLKAATQSKTFSDAMDNIDDDLKTGWSNTWEILIGDFKEAPVLWTAFANTISDIVNGSADARNKILGDFKKLGGVNSVIDTIKISFHALTAVVNIVKGAFHDVFPPATGQSLKNIADAVNKLAHAMDDKLRANADKLRAVFRGLFSAFDIGIKVVVAIGKAFLKLIPGGLGGSVLDLAVKIANMITAFDKGGKNAVIFGVNLSKLKTKFNEMLKVLDNFNEGVSKVFDYIGEKASKAMSKIIPTLTKLGSAMSKAVGHVNLDTLVGGAGVAGLVAGIKKFDKLSDSIKGFIKKFGGMYDTIHDAIKNLGGLTDVLETMTDTIKVGQLMLIAVAITAIAVSVKLIAGLTFTDIAKGLEVLAVSLVGLVTAMKAISKISMVSTSAFKTAAVIQALAFAMLELAAALKIMSTIDSRTLAYDCMALAGVLTILVAAVAALSKLSSPMKTGAGSIVLLSASIVILAAGLKILSTIPAMSIAKGLMAIGALLTEIALFTIAVNGTRLSPSVALGVGLVASALVIMTANIMIIQKIPAKEIIKGLGTMAIMLAEIAVFAKAVNGAGMVTAAAGMVLVAAALNMMIPPMLAFGNMSIESLAKGLGALAIVLTEVVLAMKGAQGGLVGAAAIVVFAAAINMLVPPLAALAMIPILGLVAALGALAAVFGIVAIAANLIGVGGAVGLLAFAAAIGAVGLAMAGIGLAFTGFAAALTVLAGMTAVGVAAVVTNFNGLLRGLKESVPLIVDIVGLAVQSMAKMIIQNAPLVGQAAVTVILTFLNTINDHIYDIVATAVQIVIHFAQALRDNIPQLVDAGAQMMIAFINGLADSVRENGPAFTSAVLSLMESILEVIVDALAKVVSVMFGWIPGVKGAAKRMGSAGKEALRTAFDIKPVGEERGNQFVNGVSGKKGAANSAGKGLGEFAKNGAGSVSLTGKGANAGQAFNSGVAGKHGAANSAGKGLGTNAQSGAGSVSLSGKGSKAGGGFSDAIRGKYGSANSAGSHIAKGGKSGAGSVSFHSAGANAGQGFANGISSAWQSAVSAAGSLGHSAFKALKSALDIHSPSKKTFTSGDFFGQGFINGIDKNDKNAETTAGHIGTTAVSALQASLVGVNSAMNDALDLQPTVKPIIDLDEVNNATMDKSLGALGALTFTNDQKLKIDFSELYAWLEKHLPKPDDGNYDGQDGDDIDINLTVYGDLDSRTARRWADPIAEALETARRRKQAPGGVVY